MVSFEDCVESEQQADGSWSCYVTDAYNVFNVPNGGYLMGIIVRALTTSQQRESNKDCLSANFTFVKSAVPNEMMNIKVELVKKGGRITVLSYVAVQGDYIRITGNACFGKYKSNELAESIQVNEIPTVDSCKQYVHENTRRRVFEQYKWWFPQTDLDNHLHMLGIKPCTQPDSKFSCFVSHENPKDRITPASLAAIVDASVPTIKGITPFGDASWVPTLTFDVQFFSNPHDLRLVFCNFYLAYQSPSRSVECCDIYHPHTGELLCCSRQSSLIGIVQPRPKL
mmetsp:Transcript_17874/g.28982  ORF Transcript_17874/g.28982 Transcript_17874/m.28982 type:complete len:283 (-) Transcript_17874:271-1119(-)